jgi:hypothetical protein
MILLSSIRCNGAEPVSTLSNPYFKDNFANLDNWQVEKWEDKLVQVSTKDGQLTIDTQSKEHGVMVWCKKELPKNFEFEYDFTPKSKIGFFLLFFCAKGNKGEDVLSEERFSDRKSRTLFKKYVEGTTNSYHISYRRGEEANCNLRKNSGLVLLKQELLSEILPADKKVHIKLTKQDGKISFTIDGKSFMNFTDDGKGHGPILEGGHIAFRQVYDSSGVYENVVLNELK